MIRRIVVPAVALGLALLTPPALPAQTGAALRQAAETITADDVKRHIGVIADDSMGGRRTGRRGLELTARYVAEQFKNAGLKPGGDDGAWLQHFMVSDTVKGLNTVGILEGSDPKLKDEYVVISAHMDHLGLSREGGGDSIYNGADDNASGTTGLIELARAFTHPGARPRRSLIFLAVSAEEGGSPPGSRYFLDHPPVPLAQVVADINMDMIGRIQMEGMIFVKGTQYSDLAAPVGRAVAAHPELRLSVVFRTDQTDGSDHAQFAMKAIPIVFFYDGGADHLAHPDYHQPTDSPEKITAGAEARVLRLVFYVGQEVANADGRPKWNEQNWQNRAQNPDGNGDQDSDS